MNNFNVMLMTFIAVTVFAVILLAYVIHYFRLYNIVKGDLRYTKRNFADLQKESRDMVESYRLELSDKVEFIAGLTIERDSLKYMNNKLERETKELTCYSKLSGEELYDLIGARKTTDKNRCRKLLVEFNALKIDGRGKSTEYYLRDINVPTT